MDACILHVVTCDRTNAFMANNLCTISASTIYSCTLSQFANFSSVERGAGVPTTSNLINVRCYLASTKM